MTDRRSPCGIRPVLWCLCGLVAGGLLVGSLSRISYARLDRANTRLEAKISALNEKHDHTIRQLENLSSELEVLRQRPVALPSPKPEKPHRVDPTAASSGIGRSEQPNLGSAGKQPWFDNLPLAVQSAIAQRLDPREITGLNLESEGGQLVYQVQGTTSDGRRVGMRLSPEGAVVSAKSEIKVDSLPAIVQEKLVQSWGEIDVRSAGEIVQDGRATYSVGGLTADRGKFNVSFSAEGELLFAETQMFVENLPGAVRTAIAGDLDPADKPIIKQVYQDERLTYQVVVSSEIEKKKLTVDPDGNVIGVEAWRHVAKMSE